jgi:hypothetical protein
MRKLTLAAVGAAALAGAGALALAPVASAQPAAPPAGPSAGPPATMMPGPTGGPMRGPQAGPWMERQGMGRQGGPWMEGRVGPWMERQGGPGTERAELMHRRWLDLARTWGLFHRPADLGLSPADVQTIASAILLRNGQHDWKVGDVTANADHTVSFAFTTAHGDVIARFNMDTRTGRISRTD